MGKRFGELMHEIKSWEKLIIHDNNCMRVFDEMALYGTTFEEYIDDYKDTEVESYKFDGRDLIIHFV